MSKGSGPRIQGTGQTGRPLGPSIVAYLQEKYGSIDNVREHLPGLRRHLSLWDRPIEPWMIDLYIEEQGGPHRPITEDERKNYRAPVPSRRTYDRQTPVVYYILFNGLVKIGTTVNLKRRLTALPHDKVLATEPGSYHLEAERHSQFRSLRYKRTREWFRYEGALKDHIESLSARA